MNSQNILKFWGTQMDLKIDSSEYHDYEVSKTESDYNSDVLNINTTINYSGLSVNTTGLTNADCVRNTISLNEFDNTVNDPTYPYSAYTWTLSYSGFTNRLSNSDTILKNDVYEFINSSGQTHYFIENGYNNALSNPFSLNVTGFTTGSTVDCTLQFSGTGITTTICCPRDPIPSAKPWAYQINHGAGVNNCDYSVKRRTEKGWTIDFVLNKDSLPWSDGNVIYYLGVRNESDIEDYADNNLSFSFTDDGRLKWTSIHYSGICNTLSGYTESYYIASGQTLPLCNNGTSDDFNITITFDRYSRYTDCNLENDGGWNDLIPGVKVIPYVPESGSSVTSTQTTIYTEVEELNKKWADEKERRLGILKIYLNGRPIYKLKDWEEIIPSDRGEQPFIQSWGSGTQYAGGVHNMGTSCFNFKQIQFYEQPLDFVHVRHHYLSEIKPNFNIVECNEDCYEDVVGFVGCEKNCYYWNVFINQNNLNSATGNTINSNNTVYVDRVNCQLDPETKQYSTSGLTYWNVCMPKLADYEFYYYVNDVKTLVTGNTSNMTITSDCCDLDKKYKLTVTGDLHPNALGSTEADLYVNGELIFHWDKDIFWVINPDVWEYGLNKGDKVYLDFKPDLCAPEVGQKDLYVYSGLTNIDSYSWYSPVLSCTGSPILSGYTTPVYTVNDDLSIEIYCPACVPVTPTPTPTRTITPTPTISVTPTFTPTPSTS